MHPTLRVTNSCMKFYSTNNKAHLVDARTAVLSGLAPDGGLYMPERIPRLPLEFFETLHEKSLQEISFTVAREFLHDVLPDEELERITTEALDFEIPLRRVGEIQVLELFHGPTFAFKDVGARFMARLMSYFVQGEKRELTILVATSGDTGSAVANGFYRVPGIRVIVLYPSGKISKLQEAQMTTLGGNVTALEVDGVFDDCQRLVKEIFVDPELREHLWLSSANSINIARLIPQTFFYFWALAQVVHDLSDRSNSVPLVISVPSGNFGNLTAGLIAKRMGLPVKKFIAATNVNDAVPEYLETAIFRPRPSIPTISNAMDVGNPSNFVRMLEFYPTVEAMREDIVGICVSEEQTREAIDEVHSDHGYQLDPHGAVGYVALRRYLQDHLDDAGIFLETAHPAKFLDVELPASLVACLTKPQQSTKLSNQFSDLKSFLLR